MPQKKRAKTGDSLPVVSKIECPVAAALVSDIVQIGSDPAQKQQMGKPFPLVLSPAKDRVVNFLELQAYFQAHHDAIIKAASEYGAVMFCGFDVASGQEWASVLYKSGLKESEYIGGAAVRKLIVGSESRMNDVQILTTNESPPESLIPFHHELAQTPNPPSHISFYCRAIDSGENGGATPIIRSDTIVEFLNERSPEFVAKLEELGVKYIKIAPEIDDASSALGRSWRAMFHVTSKEEAEAEMRKQDYTWEWLPGNDCKIISPKLPAVRACSNGNKSFFNQIIAAYTGWVDKRNEKGKGVVFSDGSLLDTQVMSDLEDFVNKEQCVFPWRAGNFVLVDNTVAAHSRQPYAPQMQRSVLASIANGCKAVDSSSSMLHYALTSGDRMPAVGFGLWKVPKDVCADTVYNAIQAGYRCFDSASDYANEAQTGEGVKRALEEGLVLRKELFIASKLWNTYHRKEHVRDACLRSLKDLQVEYLDMYYVHFPIALKFVDFATRYPPEWLHDPAAAAPRMVADDVPFRETWEAIQSLVAEGLVRNIGVCNMQSAMLRDVLSYATIKPAALQVELHPYLTQEKLHRLCRQHGIALVGFSSFASASYVEIGMANKAEALFETKAIKKIAAKYSRTPAQVVLRWAVQRGTAVIPKTSNAARMRENLGIFEFRLESEDMAVISGLNCNRRFNDPGVFCEAAFNTFFPIYD